MRINLDRVPATHDEAVQLVLDSLTNDDVEAMCAPDFVIVDVHHSIGRHLRNSWSLWERESVLVQHYRTVHRIGHADDISSLILSEVWARVRAVPFDRAACIATFHVHWKARGLNELGETP